MTFKMRALLINFQLLGSLAGGLLGSQVHAQALKEPLLMNPNREIKCDGLGKLETIGGIAERKVDLDNRTVKVEITSEQEELDIDLEGGWIQGKCENQFLSEIDNNDQVKELVPVVNSEAVLQCLKDELTKWRGLRNSAPDCHSLYNTKCAEDTRTIDRCPGGRPTFILGQSSEILKDAADAKQGLVDTGQASHVFAENCLTDLTENGRFAPGAKDCSVLGEAYVGPSNYTYTVTYQKQKNGNQWTHIFSCTAKGDIVVRAYSKGTACFVADPIPLETN